MTSENPSVWEQLSRKFPNESIGVIPRKNGLNLPYVGHATVTERLNRVLGADGWNWRPCKPDVDGIPFFDPATKTYWWALTIKGTTRYGMGEGPDPKRGESDALKRAAMRFGIALDMWAKDPLETDVLETLERKRPDGAPITPEQCGAVEALKKERGWSDAKLTRAIRYATGGLIGSIADLNATELGMVAQLIDPNAPITKELTTNV